MDDLIIALEIFMLVIVVSIQFGFFFSTLKKIKLLSNLFPKSNFDASFLRPSTTDNSLTQLIKVDNELYNQYFKEVINSINKYLIRNQGASDFAIIKSILERSIEARENSVSSNVSLPLYIGLMGTFIGVIIGLLKIAFWGGVTEVNINSFIGGVVIAMGASFFGLLLTVINNSKNFKNARAVCDERKNSFYNFLQVELLPHLGNSLFEALDKFRNNINDFNSKFERNINLFDTKFSDNISSLRTSVNSLSENINIVVENTKTQREFLIDLKKLDYDRMAAANIKVFLLLKESVPTFIKFIESQKELTESVEHANQFVGTIENILNRVKSFEENINNLGEHINTNKFLGNEVLKRIDENLRYLDLQFELLKQHEIRSSDGIKDYFEKQYQQIQKLADNIKREVQDAMNFQIDKNPFQKLHLLEKIETNITELNNKVNFNGEFKTISENVSTTKNEIQDIKIQLTNAINENIGRITDIPPKKRKPPIIDSEYIIAKPKIGFIRKMTNIFRR